MNIEYSATNNRSYSYIRNHIKYLFSNVFIYNWNVGLQRELVLAHHQKFQDTSSPFRFGNTRSSRLSSYVRALRLRTASTGLLSMS